MVGISRCDIRFGGIIVESPISDRSICSVNGGIVIIKNKTCGLYNVLSTRGTSRHLISFELEDAYRVSARIIDNKLDVYYVDKFGNLRCMSDPKTVLSQGVTNVQCCGKKIYFSDMNSNIRELGTSFSYPVDGHYRLTHMRSLLIGNMSTETLVFWNMNTVCLLIDEDVMEEHVDTAIKECVSHSCSRRLFVISDNDVVTDIDTNYSRYSRPSVLKDHLQNSLQHLKYERLVGILKQ